MAQKNRRKIRRILDHWMTALLILLMSFMATGQLIHEWLGLGMFVLVVCHQLVNIKWYRHLFRGRYGEKRTVLSIVDLLLLVSLVLCSLSGFSMSRYAVPFIRGNWLPGARALHLGTATWSFILAGIHIGLHYIHLGNRISSEGVRKTALIISCAAAAFGLYLFIRENTWEYLLIQNPFASGNYSGVFTALLESCVKLYTCSFITAIIAGIRKI